MSGQASGIAPLNAAASSQQIIALAPSNSVQLHFTLARRRVQINLCRSQGQPGIFFNALTKGARCLLNLLALPPGCFLLQLANSIQRLKQPAPGLLYLVGRRRVYSNAARPGRIARVKLLMSSENSSRHEGPEDCGASYPKERLCESLIVSLT